MADISTQLRISKALGTLVILGSFTVKLPLIYSCYYNKTTKGLVAASLYTEILALSITIIYNVLNGFPITAWGELLSVLVQNYVVVALIWIYEKHRIEDCVMKVFVYLAVTYCGKYCVPEDLLWVFPVLAMGIGWSGVIPQILTNFRNEHTGPLSLITQWLIASGSYARIFTTLYEVDDTLTLFSACVGSFFQTVIFLQIVVYRSNTKAFMEKQRKQKVIPSKVSRKTSDISPETDSTESIQQVRPEVPPEVKRKVDGMLKSFLELIDSSDALWVTKLVRSDIMIEQRKDNPFCMRVQAVLDNAPASAFEVIIDSECRKKWDLNLEENFLLKDYGERIRLIYSRSKPIWPLFARDFVLLSSCVRMNDRYINVVKSVQYDKCPEGFRERCVRAEADVMGVLIENIPERFQGFDQNSEASFENSKRCILRQIVSIDPKGNIPSWMVSTAASQTIPDGIKRMNEIIKRHPLKDSWEPKTPTPKRAVTPEEEKMSEFEKLTGEVDILTDRLSRLENICYTSIVMLVLWNVLKKG